MLRQPSGPNTPTSPAPAIDRNTTATPIRTQVGMPWDVIYRPRSMSTRGRRRSSTVKSYLTTRHCASEQVGSLSSPDNRHRRRTDFVKASSDSLPVRPPTIRVSLSACSFLTKHNVHDLSSTTTNGPLKAVKWLRPLQILDLWRALIRQRRSERLLGS